MTAFRLLRGTSFAEARLLPESKGQAGWLN